MDGFLARLREERADALLVTGDTANAQTLADRLGRLGEVARVHCVLGNHDFYGGSIEASRAIAAGASSYVPDAGPIRLTSRTVLLGVDGWGEGRAGDPTGSRVVMSDWSLIRDLASCQIRLPRASDRRLALRQKLAQLGAAEAARLDAQVDGLAREVAADPRLDRAIVLTHVPPFVGATWHDGKISDDNWLPWFTCVSTGEVLLALAQGMPQVHFTVLCGHTHGLGEYRPLPNLRVRTGGWPIGVPDYGNPIVQDTWELD